MTLSRDASGDPELVSALRLLADPDSVNRELIRCRLMTKLFHRELPRPSFGRFELREHIGQGGMGVVYRAWDPQLERMVAIKIVDTAGLGVHMRDFALREARALAKLSHPNVIPVFDSGLVGDHVWIAMEFVPGMTLSEWLAGAPRPDDALVIRQWISVGRGLAAVHAAGLVHRDVKPGNVLIGTDQRARLIDFGLVRVPDVSEIDTSSVTGSDSTDFGTAPPSPTASFVGTYAYAAPEQRAGSSIGPSADQYALCVGIWESLCGQRPTEHMQLPEGVRMSPRLFRVLTRGLAVDPDERYPDIESLLDELESAVDRSPQRTRRLLGAGMLGTAIIAMMVTAARPTEQTEPCAVDRSALEATWGSGRRTALRERLAASGTAGATTAARIEAELDAWAERWHLARRSACAATRIEGTQSDAALDLREACLQSKRRELDAELRTVLDDEAGEDLVERAPELIGMLPTLDACSDPQRLAKVDPLPRATARREALLAGYDSLTQARTLVALGNLELAEAQVGELAEASQLLAYPPLALEIEAFPAQLAIERDHVDDGVRALVGVARKAQERKLDELAASLLVEAAAAAVGHWSKPELERWLVDEATAAQRRLDREPDPLEISLRETRAHLAIAEGDLARALEGFRGARALARTLGREDAAIDLQYDIAATLGRLGRLDEAREALEAGRDAAEARWGPGAPIVAHFEFELAIAALETGAFTDASGHLDHAEAIYRAALGDDSVRVARVRFARSKLLMIEGKFQAALAEIDAADIAYTRELGVESQDTAELCAARGVLRFYTHDLPGSIESYTRALEIYEHTLGPDNPVRAGLLSNIGESELALGESELALAYFDRALTIYDRNLPDDHPDLALPLKGRGQAQLELGHAELAVTDLERALALLEQTQAEPLELADVRFSLARALAATATDKRTKVRARVLAERARDDFDGFEMSDRVEVITAWLQR